MKNDKFSLLLASAANLETLKFPVWASPKLDGIRGTVENGVAVSRNRKEFPNVELQEVFGSALVNSIDGEFIAGNPTDPGVFQTTMSVVMSESNSIKNLKFHAFDYIDDTEPFETRLTRLKRLLKGHPRFVVVEQRLVNDIIELMAFEQEMVDLGYEGIMLRYPGTFYKHGRSTEKEGILLKVKRFEHNEAKVIGTTEMMHNANVAVKSKNGVMERSSKKSGMVGKGIMGALKVIGINGDFKDVEFEIGTGFTMDQRKEEWKNGEIVRYKHQPSGAKDKPRFPVFDGRRHANDL